jgi:hypothetical protein
MSSQSFGQIIPVLGTGQTFTGAPTMLYPPKIKARPVLATTPNPIFFGSTMVVVPNASGGGDNWQSVADFIAGGGTMTAARFAGIAVRNVTATLGFPYPPGGAIIGSYLQGTQCEGLVWGDVGVTINVGTPVSQGPVYLRILVNGSIPAGKVGDLEAAADGTNTIELSGVVFTNGVLDQNNNTGITLLTQQSA